MRHEKKALTLDEVVRAFVRAAQDIDKNGGYLRGHLEFGAKPQPAQRQDKPQGEQR